MAVPFSCRLRLHGCGLPARVASNSVEALVLAQRPQSPHRGLGWERRELAAAHSMPWPWVLSEMRLLRFRGMVGLRSVVHVTTQVCQRGWRENRTGPETKKSKSRMKDCDSQRRPRSRSKRRHQPTPCRNKLRREDGDCGRITFAPIGPCEIYTFTIQYLGSQLGSLIFLT